MTIKNQYKTSDLALSAYLSLRGFVITKIEGDPSDRRKWFVFEGKKIEKEVEKYLSKETLVDPIDYFNELKSIKSRLYQNL